MEQIPESWQTLLVSVQMLATVTFAIVSVFFFFAKREWNRITKNIHDVRNTITGMHLSLREVSTLTASIPSRVDEIEAESKENGKAVSRIEGRIRDLPVSSG